ncbi:RNA-directed DNA polymerase, eukaryota, reverse transcriptase zinc-binding domain protein [Tanacetum coccineum]
MWGKFGLKEIISQNGMFLFKFKHEEGMESVLEAGSWMVNNKPLLIQRWDPSVCIDKKEPEKYHLGKPLIMDRVTTQMCNEGTGRLGYARVLVEISAKDELKDRIELCYKDKNKVTNGTKFVGVEYALKPVKCSHCSVFGHDFSKCEFNPDRLKDNVKISTDRSKETMQDREGFIQVKKAKENKNNGNGNLGSKMQGNQKRQEFRSVRKEGHSTDTNMNDTMAQKSTNVPKTPNKDEELNVSKEVIEAIRKSANKFSVLDQCEDETLEGITAEEKSIVDKYVKENTQPSMIVTKDWSYNMVNYFKDQWKKYKEWEEDDVVVDENEMAISVAANNMRGIDGSVLFGTIDSSFQ